jgi:hypothetical protein
MKVKNAPVFWILPLIVLFSISFARTNAAQDPAQPAKATPLAFGRLTTGHVKTGETMTYSFPETAGKKVIVRISKLSGRLNPEIRLLGPDGSVIAETWSSGMAELVSGALPVTGTYRVIARDHWGTDEGEFSLALARINPGNAAPLSFGQAVSGVLGAGDLKSYVFQGKAGDRISIRASQAPATTVLYVQVRLFDPEGAELREEWAPSVAEIQVLVLPADGVYTIVISDFYGTSAGEYTLTLDRFAPANR